MTKLRIQADEDRDFEREIKKSLNAVLFYGAELIDTVNDALRENAVAEEDQGTLKEISEELTAVYTKALRYVDLLNDRAKPKSDQYPVEYAETFDEALRLSR